VQVGYALGVAMPGEDAPADAAALRAEAVALAAKSDVAVVVVGYSFKLESEGFDRPSLDLPAGQDELIAAVAAANRNTVVVVAAGSPVTMTGWLGKVAAVLYAWYGGQEAGHAVGDLLLGRATPSGKLPFSYPARIEDTTAHGHYPGERLHVTYGEGIWVGYRGLDKRGVAPLFPFGFGLSYASFEYSGLRVAKPVVRQGEPLGVSVRVRNTGSRAAAEVVQLYIRDVEASVERPEKELKGFRRVALAPGETKTVDFTIDTAALSFFDPKKDDWVAEPGAFEALVGASSRDVRGRAGFMLAN
jgi:beta-glucosidase